MRDFVHVSDVTKANVAVIRTDLSPIGTLNVGSGEPLTLRDVAVALSEKLPRNGRIEHTGKYRVGDILGCYAHQGRASIVLGDARVTFDEGIRFLSPWLKQVDVADRSKRWRRSPTYGHPPGRHVGNRVRGVVGFSAQQRPSAPTRATLAGPR